MTKITEIFTHARHVLTMLLLAGALSACTTVRDVHGVTAAQRQVLVAEGFVDTPDGWLLSMQDQLLFDVDSSEIKAQMRNRIQHLSENLLRVGIDHARIDGHTDNSGTAEHNQALSLSRAQSVAMVMTQSGFTESRLTAVGRGETSPIADNDSVDGRQRNRRVNIIISST